MTTKVTTQHHPFRGRISFLFFRLGISNNQADLGRAVERLTSDANFIRQWTNRSSFCLSAIPDELTRQQQLVFIYECLQLSLRVYCILRDEFDGPCDQSTGLIGRHCPFLDPADIEARRDCVSQVRNGSLSCTDLLKGEMEIGVCDLTDAGLVSDGVVNRAALQHRTSFFEFLEHCPQTEVIPFVTCSQIFLLERCVISYAKEEADRRLPVVTGPTQTVIDGPQAVFTTGSPTRGPDQPGPLGPVQKR